MLLLPQSPISVISPTVLRYRVDPAIIVPLSADAYMLRDLCIAGQPLPDLAVRVSAAAMVAKADGILGYNFFGQFTEVRRTPATNNVVLVYEGED
jgi:hypothetical protein